MDIAVLTTGGTFDKQYNKITGKLYFTSSSIERIIDLSGITSTITVEHILMKDSLDMLDKDRDIIAKKCAQRSEKHMVIIHGTDTMVETASKIAEQVKDKTIILTGAIIPYSIQDSDALFNFGVAISHAQLLPAGVYISMHGRYFPHNDVRKDKSKAIFVNK